MASEADKQRIAELEQEVARLRARLDADESQPAPRAQQGDGQQHQPDEEAQWREMVQDAAPQQAEHEAASGVRLPSRRRAVAISLALGLAAFVAIAAIVMALSSLIQPLSKKAAQSLEPFEGQPGSSQPAPPVKAADDPLRVPGL